jgi:hypothetical protein
VALVAEAAELLEPELLHAVAARVSVAAAAASAAIRLSRRRAGGYDKDSPHIFG